MEINSKIKSYLDRLVESKTRPSSYIFAGADEAEKTEASIWFVSRLAGMPGKAEFFERVKSKNHPDVVIIEPEIEEKKGKIREKEISIGQVKEMLGRLNFFPYELKKKFCVIKKAQKMNPEASNALLKSLEEPSEKAIFILLADNADSILPTIVSRCAILRFPQSNLPEWREENRDKFKNILRNEVHERFEYIEKISKNKNELVGALKDWEMVMGESLRKLIETGEDFRKINKVIEMVENTRQAINRLERTNAGARGVGEELVLNF